MLLIKVTPENYLEIAQQMDWAGVEELEADLGDSLIDGFINPDECQEGIKYEGDLYPGNFDTDQEIRIVSIVHGRLFWVTETCKLNAAGDAALIDEERYYALIL